jgi:hypothetical protein
MLVVAGESSTLDVDVITDVAVCPERQAAHANNE